MPHPDEGLIHAWLDGELDATESARVEALVASDAEWAAAAAEARGLIAASTRIVGALDRVPANVIPQAAPRRNARRWAWRAAAALVLMAGSAVVLKRGNVELPPPPAAPAEVQTAALPPLSAPAVGGASAPTAKTTPSKAAPATANAPVAKERSSFAEKELDAKKQIETKTEPARDKDAMIASSDAGSGARAAAPGAASGVTLGAARANASIAGARPAEAQQPAAPPPSLSMQADRRAVAAKAATPSPNCFEQREPLDSAMRVIRLDAGQLADSVRLESLTLRGDTLAAVHGRLRAVRVPCPAP
jgi:hypothetical protein